MPTFALVMNTDAGAMLAGATFADTVRQGLVAAGISLHDMPPGKLPDRIAQAAASGADAIVVVGGDGTVACASQHLAGQDLPLGIIPAGTMNMLARDLRIPIDAKAALDTLISGTVRRIDVGQVGEHVFACACMLGTPARIGHHRERARKHGNGPLAWLQVARAAVRAGLRRHRLHVTLTVDGTATRIRTKSLNITVNRLDDASGRAYGRTVMDGGQLCAYVLRSRNAWQLLRLAGRLATGSSRDPGLQRFCGREIEVAPTHVSAGTDAALRILIDGEEHLLSPPLRFHLRPRALGVIAPHPT